MDTVFFLKVFGSLFAIMNPFVYLPFFLSMTNGFTVAEQRILGAKITLYTLVMCVVLSFAGDTIIRFFGLTVNEFRIAGGLVLISISWSMLNGQKVTSHQGTSQEQSHMAFLNDIAFYPMTFPMAIGPGTIATIIINMSQARDFRETLTVLGVLLLVVLLLFLVMFYASLFGRALSETMRVIMTRLMGMILLAIAVELIIGGLKGVFPALAVHYQPHAALEIVRVLPFVV